MRALLLLLPLLACTRDEPDDTAAEPDADTDADTDSDTDADTDADTDSDADTDVEPEERRWDCSAMDPHDAAPLGGWVALTFDDGPDPIDTPAILEVLRTYEVPATFFVLGDRLSEVEAWPVAEAIVDDPLFDLANHSWSHPVMTDLSPSAQADEIDDTTALIETFGVDVRYFRFPYGMSDCDLVDDVAARGLLRTGWHIDTADWCYAAVGDVGVCTPDDYWRVPEEYQADMHGFVREQVKRFDGGVVLLHDIHAWTAAELETLILNLTADGFTFTSLDDEVAFPELNAGTPADLPYLGEPCDTRDDRCWQVEYASWCEPTNPEDSGAFTGICTLPCEGGCLDRDGAATTFCATVPPGAGQCVSRSEAINDWCGDVPGTIEADVDRFVGESGWDAVTRTVCVPPGWVE